MAMLLAANANPTVAMDPPLHEAARIGLLPLVLYRNYHNLRV